MAPGIVGTASTVAAIEQVRDKLRGALWGLFIGDALASPTHWFYGGRAQIVRAYGGPITGYTKPSLTCEGSIMNKSNTGGAGRGSSQGDVIGTVINHGKKDYWKPGQSIHYHCTLEAGENTLEASLVRLLLRIVAAAGGKFDADTFRREYVQFMTTPGSHNDCYASTCHRMFFQNLVSGMPAESCPSNDGHNVDTIDGLVLPTVTALASVFEPQAAASAAVRACVKVTRKSAALEEYAVAWGALLREIVLGSPLRDAALHACNSSRVLAKAARDVHQGRYVPVVA